MKKEPLVSVIIPTYNRAHLIRETLDSVLAQTYQNWECIIVDDGSSDNTDEVVGEYVKKDSRFKYYHRLDEHLPGGNGARNYGFNMSKGEYVNWFDSDDLMDEVKIEIQVKLLLDSKKNFCVCQTMAFENTVNNLRGLRKKSICSIDPLNDFIQSKIKWLTQSPIIKSEFIKKNDLLFYEPLKKAQEYEFFIRVLSIDSDYCFTNKHLVYLRNHSDRISSNGYDLKKNESIYKASYKILAQIGYKINPKSISVLKNSLINCIFIAYYNSDYRSSIKLIKVLREDKLISTSELLFLYLGLISYKLSGKGYFILKILKNL